MKYLLLLLPILLISCWQDIEYCTENCTEILYPEAQWYPEYIFSEEKIEDMHIYLINAPVPIEWAVKYEALKKRVPTRITRFNTWWMFPEVIESFEYVNNTDWEFRYKVTNNSWEINFYKIQYNNEWYVSVPHFILDNDYFF